MWCLLIIGLFQMPSAIARSTWEVLLIGKAKIKIQSINQSAFGSIFTRVASIPGSLFSAIAKSSWICQQFSSVQWPGHKIKPRANPKLKTSFCSWNLRLRPLIEMWKRNKLLNLELSKNHYFGCYRKRNDPTDLKFIRKIDPSVVVC